MSTQQGTGWCKHCGHQVVLQRDGCNHVLHLLLSVFTFGLWLGVWGLDMIVHGIGGWRCQVCGSLTRRQLFR